MKGQRLTFAPGAPVEVEEFDVPEPAPNQILVRITRSQVSAGSEMNFIRHGHAAYGLKPRDGGPPRLALGYMAVGRISAIGEGVTGYAIGERVLTGSTHSSHWLADPTLPTGHIAKLPEAVPDDEAGFAILGDVALHGVRRAALQIDESVAVFGVGIVGQLTLQLARLAGAYPLIAVDLVESRLESAKDSGATHAVHAAREDPVQAIREITGGAGAETLFHCAAVPHILQSMMEAAAKRGTIVLSGSAPGTAQIRLQEELLRRELTVVGNYELGLSEPHPYWPWTRQRNRLACLRLMASGQLRVGHLITHVVPCTQAQQVFDMMLRGSEDWLGVVLKWD